MLARLELGGTVSAAMVIENDLPAAWAADAIARRAVIAGLIVAFCKAAGRG